MAPVFAYIDPSSGMLTIQLIIASVAGGLVFARSFLTNAIRKFTGRKKDE
jgi:hypothetical protein